LIFERSASAIAAADRSFFWNNAMIHRFALVASVLFTSPTLFGDPPLEVKLDVVKWPGLEKAIAAHKGKVVLIDIWADFCIPCKKEFPHFIELHHKYAKDGLVCISVSVDDIDDKERTLKFLRSQKATTINYLIDESADVWQNKLDATVPPNAIIFGRDGQRVKRFSAEAPFTYEDVGKAVKSALEKK
jgi:thiol-disulfide isomerase/thioredoxin